MAEINPCSWLQNAGATHTASQMRASIGSVGAGLSLDLNGRGGVNPSLGGALEVTQTGPLGGLSVDVDSGIVHIPGTSASVQGIYICINDNPVTLTITDPDGTNPRIDAIIAHVHDDFYDAGGENQWELEVVDGTPQSSPDPPEIPDNSFVLANVSVAVGATEITDSDISDLRIFTPIGVLPVADQDERDALAAVHNGLAVWVQDTEDLDIRGASGWISPTRPPVSDLVFAEISQAFANFNSNEFVPTSPSCEITFTSDVNGNARIDAALRIDFDVFTVDRERFIAGIELRRDGPTGTILQQPTLSASGDAVSFDWPFSGEANPFVWSFTWWWIFTGLSPNTTHWAQLQWWTGEDSVVDIHYQKLLFTPTTSRRH